MTTTARIVLLAVVVAQNCQSSPPRTVLSATHQANIQAETLTPIRRVHDLPPFVREALRAAFEEASLQMADPQTTSKPILRVPWRHVRRLVIAGCGPDHCLVHYERTGYGTSFHLVVVGLNAHDAQIEWNGFTRRRLDALSELKSVVLRNAGGT